MSVADTSIHKSITEYNFALISEITVGTTITVGAGVVAMITDSIVISPETVYASMMVVITLAGVTELAASTIIPLCGKFLTQWI